MNSTTDNGMNVRGCGHIANTQYTSAPVCQSSYVYQAASVTDCRSTNKYQSSLNNSNSILNGHSGITEMQPSRCSDIQRGATYPTFSPLAQTYTTIF